MNLRQILANDKTISREVKSEITDVITAYIRFVEHWTQYGLRPLQFYTLGSLAADPRGFSEINPEGLTSPFMESYLYELESVIERTVGLLKKIIPSCDPKIFTPEQVYGS